MQDSLDNLLKFSSKQRSIRDQVNSIIEHSNLYQAQIGTDEDIDDSASEMSNTSSEEDPEDQDDYKLLTPLNGSVAYGLPTLAVTRRSAATQRKLREIEDVNRKLCKIMREDRKSVV